MNLPNTFRKQGQQMSYDGYDKAPCDLYCKEQVTQLQEQNTRLDKVASDLQDLCDKRAKALGEQDAVLKQVLSALEFDGWKPSDAAHLVYVTKAIEAIKEVLK